MAALERHGLRVAVRAHAVSAPLRGWLSERIYVGKSATRDGLIAAGERRFRRAGMQHVRLRLLHRGSVTRAHRRVLAVVVTFDPAGPAKRVTAHGYAPARP
jgi:hypothetical protein